MVAALERWPAGALALEVRGPALERQFFEQQAALLRVQIKERLDLRYEILTEIDVSDWAKGPGGGGRRKSSTRGLELEVHRARSTSRLDRPARAVRPYATVARPRPLGPARPAMARSNRYRRSAPVLPSPVRPPRD